MSSPQTESTKAFAAPNEGSGGGNATPDSSPGQRWLALDWLRGVIMVLMAWDHASMYFFAGRVSPDSSLMYSAGSALPVGPYLVRWITHLCAPGFLFTAGVALSLSYASRAARGASDRAFDLDLLIRAAIFITVEFTLIRWAAGMGLLFQVMYAFACAYLFMILLRRLSPRLIVLGVVAFWLAYEAIVVAGVGIGTPTGGGWLWSALLTVRVVGEPMMLYPALPWASMLVLGWVAGECWMSPAQRARGHRLLAGRFLWAGWLALVCFMLIRALDGYGNMGIFRAGDNWLRWLHVSKYPPALSFVLLELGLICVLLAFLLHHTHARGPSKAHPLTVFGQTAMFFYLLHFVVLKSITLAGVSPSANIALAVALWLAFLLVAYPICIGYRRLKASGRWGWLRYV